MNAPFAKAVLFAVIADTAGALTAPTPAQSPERLMVAPGPPDIRVVAVDLAFYERDRQGWMKSGGPKIGGMVAVRCSYVYTAGAEAPLWLVAFQEGDTLRERTVGPGLLDPITRQTSRTWYAKLVAPGASQIACVADADNQVAESDESNNRIARTLDVPAADSTTPAQPGARAAPASRLAIVTARDAALARGSDPAFDLRFVEAAGTKRAGDPRALRAIPSIATAAVGEPIAINCGYRVHMDAPNGETARIAPWQVSIERDGQAMHGSAGKTDLVSTRGATNVTDVIARWTPTQAGTYRFRCRLDTSSAIAETDETNNVVDFTLQVGTATTGAAPPAKPKPMPRGQPQLAFAATKLGAPAMMGPTESTVYKSYLKLSLKWQSPNAAAYDWRWQVSLWPFPADPSVPPPALLREGVVTKNVDNVFSIDLGSFPPLGQPAKTGKTGPPGAANGAKPPTAPAAPAKPGTQARAVKPPAVGTKTPGAEFIPQSGGTQANLTKTAPPQASAGTPGVADAPIDFHIRILPLKGGKPAGAPSNVVIAHYKPGPNPHDVAASEAITAESTKKQKLAEMNEQATVYKIHILSFERPVFANPGRYGCIVVVTNPYETKLGHPLFQFHPGEEYCPKKNPDYQQKTDWEQFLEGVEGYAHAWNGLSWFYDKAKDYAATMFAEVIVPCGLLEELGDDAASTCQEIAKELASTAISVGLTAAGVPPSIPDLEGMSDLAKGKAAKAAAGYTCDLIETEGGECTPEMRKGLEEAYAQGIDQLQKDLIKQSKEPDCGNFEEANAHGLLPLPCFSNFPGAEVKPAPGSVETSPAVKARITRTKPDPKFATDCGVHASLVVKNDIPGYGQTEATPWPAAKAPIPPISGVDGSSVVTLNFGPRQPWHPSGKQGATAEWNQLLMGGTGTLKVMGPGTAAAQPPLPSGKVSVDCALGPGPKTLSIPQDFTQQPWKIIN
jgi:hypothetical protein